MKVLLIGGAGFIGARTALRLLDQGHEVAILDSLDPQIHGDDPLQSQTLAILQGRAPVEKGDTRDSAALDRALAGAEAVYYFPACTGTGQSMYRVEQYCDVNVRGVGVFAEALSRYRDHIGKVIVSSTRAVYGEGAALCPEHGRVFPFARRVEDLEAGRFGTVCPICHQPVEPSASHETDPVAPASIYGITKLAQEQIVANTAQSLGIPAIIFRYQNVYGPGQSLKNPYTGILSIFTQLLLAGREINLFEDAQPTRDFVHVDDVVAYNVRALTAPVSRVAALNVGSGHRASLVDLVQALGGALGIEPRYFVSGQFRLGDIRHAAADLAALRRVLGSHEFVSLDAGMRTFTDWVRAQELSQEANAGFDRSLSEMQAAGLLKTAKK